MSSDDVSQALPPGRPRVKSIEALRRGLLVESLLMQRGVLSLDQIFRTTGIPKATLLRILGTLEVAGRVHRRMADGSYLPVARTDPHVGATAARWSKASATSLLELHRRLPWPSDIAVPDGLHMHVLESNRPLCAVAVNRGVVGFRPDMLESALGRAYIGSCAEDERRRILDGLRAQRHRSTRSAARVQLIVEEVRRLGYGRRDPSHIGPDAHSAARYSAIAVPIRSEGLVVGCLSCVWLVEVIDEATIVLNYADLLRQQADRIGDALLRQDRPAAASTCG